MALQVKIILHRGPNECELPRKEIRRFEIEDSAVGSYEYFRQKIVTLYPDLTNESPFRLMWTDDEGDNVCFSSDEELSQAIRFINSQENKLFKCIVKFPQPQNQPAAQNPPKPANTDEEPAFEQFQAEPGTSQGHPGVNQFGGGCNKPGFNQKKMEKFQNKLMKNMAKMQNMQKGQSQDFMKHMQQHWAQMGNVTKCTVDQTNGDVEMHVDIPIHHSDGTTTCSSTGTTVTTTVDKDGNHSTKSSNVYPDLNQDQMAAMTQVTQNTQLTQMATDQSANDFEDLSQEANEAKLSEAVAKMAELGFTGNWVRELLLNVNGDIAKAVEAMNPSK